MARVAGVVVFAAVALGYDKFAIRGSSLRDGAESGSLKTGSVWPAGPGDLGLSVSREKSEMRTQTQRFGALAVVGSVAVLGAAAICEDAAAQAAVQWRVEDGGNGHWYAVVVPAAPTPPEAYQALALSKAAYLVSITSQAEDIFVHTTSVSVPGAWVNTEGPVLGGRRVACAFTWYSGEPWGYTSWGPADPSGCQEPNLRYCGCTQGGGPTPRYWIDTDSAPYH